MSNHDDLHRNNAGQDLESFWMNSITVDGITTRNTRDFGYEFFNFKTDYYTKEERNIDEDGFIIDELVGVRVFWDSPYDPIPLSLGEIDEETWLKTGVVRAEKSPELE